MLRFVSKTLAWTFGLFFGGALVAKFLLQSNADPDTQDLDLVSIFEGHQLASHADPLYGGRIMTMFGGVMLDMREATPAPTGVYIDVFVVMGGVSLVVPEGWRVVYTGNTIVGGYSDETRTTAETDVPTVNVSGTILMGGLRATTKDWTGVTI